MANRKTPTLSPSARKIMQAQRRQLNQAAQKSADSARDRAREEWHRRQSLAASRNPRTSDAVMTSLAAAIQRTTSAVASTWGVNLPIYVSFGVGLTAYTDYSSIRVEYPRFFRRGLYDRDLAVEGVVGLDTDTLRGLLAEVRGIVYHEVGHVRFTTPLPTLSIAVAGAAEDVQSQWHSLPNRQWLWNLLEDQRMETRVVAESPVIGTYLTGVIAHLFAPTPLLWAFVAGRRFLPQDLRDAARQRFAEEYGDAPARGVEQAIQQYCAATSEIELVEAVIRFGGVLNPYLDSNDLPASGNSTHDRQRWGQGVDPADSATPAADSQQGESAEDEGAEDEGAEGASGGQGDSGEDAEGGQGDSGEDAASSNSEPSSAQSASGGDSCSRSLNEVLEEFRQSAKDAVAEQSIKDPTIERTIETMIDEAQRIVDGELMRVVGERPLAGEALADADMVADLMREAFDTHVAACAPMWQHRTNRGVIDPFAYRTREPGSQDFRRQYVDNGDLGRSLAVSLVLDVSGSMEGHGESLGAAAYATATACRALDIPITVTTFGSNAAVLFSADDDTIDPMVLRCSGGTNAEPALSVLADQRHDKLQHIAIILTDGLWSSSDLRHLSEVHDVVDGVFVLGFHLDDWVLTTFKAATETMSLQSLWDLPTIVQSLVSERLGS